MNMKKIIGIGIGIGCALSAMGLLYIGSNLLPFEGLTLRPGLMLLSSISLIVLGAKFIAEADALSELPMPPAVPKMAHAMPKMAAKKAKKPAKKGKKKGKK